MSPAPEPRPVEGVDQALLRRWVRLRRLYRAQAARCRSAFLALVTLNDEFLATGARVACYAADGAAGTCYATFHAGPQGEAFGVGAMLKKSAAKPFHLELGERCHRAHQLWRRRAMRLGQLQEALKTVVRELAYDAPEGASDE